MLTCRVSVAVVGVLAAVGCGSSRSDELVASVESRPSPAAWSVRAGVPRVRNGALRFAAIAAHEGTVAVVGSVLSEAEPGSPLAATPVLWIEGRGRVDPVQQRGAAYHKLIYDRLGRLHLVWSEVATDGETPPQWISPPVALWHSVLGSNGWAMPERILAAPWMSWSEGNSVLAIDGKNRLHVVVAVMDTIAGFETIDLRRDETAWRRTRIAPGGTAVSIAASPPDLVAVVASSLEARSMTGVLQVRSTDDGDRWSPPVQLATPGAQSIQSPQVVMSGDRVFAAWAEIVDDPRPFRVVVVAMEDGAPSGTREERDVPGMPRRLSTAADGCGGFAAFVEIRRSDVPVVEIHELRWPARSGLSLHRPFPEFAETVDAALVLRGRTLEAHLNAASLTDRTSRNVLASRSCR